MQKPFNPVTIYWTSQREKGTSALLLRFMIKTELRLDSQKDLKGREFRSKNCWKTDKLEYKGLETSSSAQAKHHDHNNVSRCV